jgi:hypothetical protein
LSVILSGGDGGGGGGGVHAGGAAFMGACALGGFRARAMRARFSQQKQRCGEVGRCDWMQETSSIDKNSFTCSDHGCLCWDTPAGPSKAR